MTTPLPDLGMTATTTTPATATASVATRPAAGSTTTSGGAFGHLMQLQSRGRALEAKLQQAASAATPGDPAATAIAKQAAFTASKLEELRELVGPKPGGNARRALAAMITRLESSTDANNGIRASDRARLKLAIAADEGRVDLAGAKDVRSTILALDEAMKAIHSQTSDPTLAQDPARMAQFQQQSKYAQERLDRVDSALSAGRVDPAAIRKSTDPMSD